MHNLHVTSIKHTTIEIGGEEGVFTLHVSWGFGEFLVHINARREPIVNWGRTCTPTSVHTRQPQGHLAHYMQAVKAFTQLLWHCLLLVPSEHACCSTVFELSAIEIKFLRAVRESNSPHWIDSPRSYRWMNSPKIAPKWLLANVDSMLRWTCALCS